jgi:hypothetical protein
VQRFKKYLIIGSFFFTGCVDIVTPTPREELLVIIESNTSWIGKIDTFTVTSKIGEDIRWFMVNQPVCWTITKTSELGMVRAYGTTPDFTYGWTLEQKKYPLWGDMNTVNPNGVIRGCIPEDVRY